MNYGIQATSISKQDAAIRIKQSIIDFGTTSRTAETLPNPAELFLGSFASCILKNIERFSGLMKFTYTKATLEVHATRLEHPPRIENIDYTLLLFTNDEKLNLGLLKKNIEKFGTIYNTVKLSCSVTGTISIINNV